MMPVDFAKRQQVEGFAKLIYASGQPALGRRPMKPDFRGPSEAGQTREWWLEPDGTPVDVVWQTAPVPQAVDTTFTFVGESANLPENLYPANQAKLYIDGTYALTFDLGQRGPRTWLTTEFAMQWEPRQVHATAESYHRQFEVGGCCGIYRVSVPSWRLRAGQAVQLRVVLEPTRSDAVNWFAVRERTDVLEVSPRTGESTAVFSHAGQIAQLQQELIHLKRVVGNLARRSYPELFPERLKTEDVLVYMNGRAHVHPPDVLLLQNGDLLCAFREASEHLSLDGKLAMVRSRDGGRTWGEHQILRETPHTDEREVNLNQLRDGTVLVSGYPDDFYSGDGRYTSPRRDPTYKGRGPGIYVGRSSDNGRTWVHPTETMNPAPFDWLMVSERIIELPNGRLLMPVYASYESGAKNWGCAVYASNDKGFHWQHLATVAYEPNVNLGEPAMVRTRTGRLIMMMRKESPGGHWQSNSDDDGRTWSKPVETNVPGANHPCSLVELPSGEILCIYGTRGDPGGIYGVASKDNGETWDMAHRRVIRDDFVNMDIGYPSSVLMPDGRMLVAYYFNLFGRFCITGSFFRWE